MIPETAKERATQARVRPRLPRQRRGVVTVRALRNAAARMLRKGEAADVSVSELARAAGVSVGTFYHYYPTKEALLLDLREQLLSRSLASLLEGFARPITSGQAFLAAFGELLRGWVQLAQKTRGLERAVAAVSFSKPAFARALRAQERGAEDAVAALIAVHASVLRPVEPAIAARVIVLLVTSFVMDTMRDPDLARDPEPAIREVSRMVARYLFPPRERVR